MPNPKFQVFTGKNEEYYFRLRAGNGETVLASEGYKSKSGALNGVESVQNNAASHDRYERKESSNGQFYFTLRATNNETIGKSEMYTSASSRDEGIEVVKNIAASAPIEDTTS